MDDRDSKDHLEPTTGVGSRCTIKTERRADGTIVITVTGTVSVPLAFRVGLQLKKELDDKPCNLILDASGVEAFDGDAKEPFAEALVDFKARQGNLAIVVVDDKNLVLKMMFVSVAGLSISAGGPKPEIVSTFHEALVRISRRPEEMESQQ